MEKLLKIIKIVGFVIIVLLFVFLYFFDDIFGPITNNELISDFQKMKVVKQLEKFEHKTAEDGKTTIWFSDIQNYSFFLNDNAFNEIKIYAKVEVFPTQEFPKKAAIKKVVHLKTKEVPTNTLVLELSKENIRITVVEDTDVLRSENPLKFVKRIIEYLAE